MPELVDPVDAGISADQALLGVVDPDPDDFLRSVRTNGEAWSSVVRLQLQGGLRRCGPGERSLQMLVEPELGCDFVFRVVAMIEMGGTGDAPLGIADFVDRFNEVVDMSVKVIGRAEKDD